MATIGIDIGSLSTKAVLLKDHTVAALKVIQSGDDVSTTVADIKESILSSGGLRYERIDKTAFTGVGKDLASPAGSAVPDAKSGVAGTRFYNIGITGLIDIGAENSRVVKLDKTGRIIGFASNDKCAAGTGIFLDTMAKLLQVNREDEIPAGKGGSRVDVTSTCVVFAESEVVSLIHKGTDRFDLWLGINRSVANRVITLVHKLRPEGTIGIIGGVAKNPTFISCLREVLGDRLFIPRDPEFVNALGASIIAQEQSA